MAGNEPNISTTPKHGGTNFKSKLLWTFVTLAIAALTIFAVFANNETVSPATIVSALSEASPFWLAMAFLCMFGYILFEALALLCILKNFGCRKNFFQGLVYSASDVYFSAITPSATGGQPASALFMARNKVPGACITATLVLNLAMYTAATIAIGIACLVIRPDLFLQFSTLGKAFIVFSMLALLGLTTLFVVLLQNATLLYRIGCGLISVLTRIRLMKHRDLWMERLTNLTDDYRTCVRLVAGRSGVLASAFILNLLQRLSQISVTLMLFYALGGTFGEDGLDLWIIQAYAQIGSNCIPIPGGMGAADYLMLTGFQLLFDRSFAYQLHIISRGLSFYVCTALSGVIVLAGFTIGRARVLRKRRALSISPSSTPHEAANCPEPCTKEFHS